jgi:hypothetical protein
MRPSSRLAHLHHYQDEWIYVVEGEFEFTVGVLVQRVFSDEFARVEDAAQANGSDEALTHAASSGPRRQYLQANGLVRASKCEPRALTVADSDSGYDARRSLTTGRWACPAIRSTTTSKRAPGLPATSAQGKEQGEPRGQSTRGSIRGRRFCSSDCRSTRLRYLQFFCRR